MVAVATSEMDAGMWLPATLFAVCGPRYWVARSIFQTIGLVVPEGFDAHGK
jgi:hypothetical protein